MNREQLEEELTCTCGAGHGSTEGHMPWCDWTESNKAEAEEPYGYVYEERTPPSFTFSKTRIAIRPEDANEYELSETPVYTSPVPALTDEAVERATHRHKKRGSEYVLIGIGKMQASDWFDLGPPPEDDQDSCVDMREVAIYRSVDDGSIWVRPRENFEDGRFEALAAFPSKGEGE